MVLVGSENEDIDEDVQENEVLVPIEPEGEETNDQKEKEKKLEMEEEKKEGNLRQKSEVPAVTFLTEETKNNYTLHNLVIPLVGRDIPLLFYSNIS